MIKIIISWLLMAIAIMGIAMMIIGLYIRTTSKEKSSLFYIGPAITVIAVFLENILRSLF